MLGRWSVVSRVCPPGTGRPVCESLTLRVSQRAESLSPPGVSRFLTALSDLVDPGERGLGFGTCEEDRPDWGAGRGGPWPPDLSRQGVSDPQSSDKWPGRAMS